MNPLSRTASEPRLRRSSAGNQRALVTQAIVALVLAAGAAHGQNAEAEPPSACPRGDSAQAGTRGALELKAAITSATVDAQTYGADLFLQNHAHPEACGWRRQRTLIRIAPTYDSKRKEGGAPVITRSYIVSVQQLAYLPGNRFYLSANARYLHNNSLGVYLQQVYTLLMGTEADWAFFSVELNAGPAFVGQHFLQGEPSTGFVAPAISERVSIPLGFISDTAELSQSVSVILPVRSQDPWLVTGLVQLHLPLSKRLSINVRADEDYLSNAPTGFEKNYFTTSVGISIKLGRP